MVRVLQSCVNSCARARALRFLCVAGVAAALAMLLGCSGSTSGTGPSQSPSASWQKLNQVFLRQVARIDSFAFSDNAHGWAVAWGSADRPQLFASEDRGRGWTLCKAPIVGAPESGADSLPPSIDRLALPGQVVCEGKSLFLSYFARQYGVLHGAKIRSSSGILVSVDAGRSWRRILSLSTRGDSVLRLLASDATHIWALCGSGIPFDRPPAYLLRSDDAGAHWKRLPPGTFADGGVGLVSPSVMFVDRSHGWSVLRRLDRFGSEIFISTTADGGQTWVPVSQPANVPPPPVFYALDASHAWIAGGFDPHTKSALCATADGGKTWRRKYFGDLTVTGVIFTDSSHGWLVGSNASRSVIFSTLDGGRRWTKEYSLSDQKEGWVFSTAGSTLFVSNGFVLLSRSLPPAAQ
jgi:photosystem II stability/assembly factor-like uncharacterized protein